MTASPGGGGTHAGSHGERRQLRACTGSREGHGDRQPNAGTDGQGDKGRGGGGNTPPPQPSALYRGHPRDRREEGGDPHTHTPPHTHSGPGLRESSRSGSSAGGKNPARGGGHTDTAAAPPPSPAGDATRSSGEPNIKTSGHGGPKSTRDCVPPKVMGTGGWGDAGLGGGEGAGWREMGALEGAGGFILIHFNSFLFIVK